MSLRETLAKRQELPLILLANVLSDSLMLMRVFYGSIRPSESRTLWFRLELLRAVQMIADAYPGDILDNHAHQTHYLVLVAEVAGATEYDSGKCAGRSLRNRFLVWMRIHQILQIIR
jgi:hypothetical protein